jgi:hypothetical protein
VAAAMLAHSGGSVKLGLPRKVGTRAEAHCPIGKRFGGAVRLEPKSRSRWVRRAEVDDGARPGLLAIERRRLAELERENRELRRASEILKAASRRY